MIQQTDISEYHRSYQFFMFRPSRSISSFILILSGFVIIVTVWAFIMKMDDVIKAPALLRPTETISTVKAFSGGEVLRKNYSQDSYVYKGDSLLQLNIDADLLELKNSKNLMERVIDKIDVDNILLQTIRLGKNSSSKINEEAYIRSEAYIIEYNRLLNQINTLQVKVNREQALPDSFSISQHLEDLLQELKQTEFQCSLWKNNQMINTINEYQNLTLNKENLERRISDLERNIRNATFLAPISGRINELRQLNIGDYIFAGEDIFTIVPVNATSFKAELSIDPAYIAQVKIGQKVSLLLPGLPPSKFGKLEAEISMIPADYAEGINSIPVFKVEANIKNPWLVSTSGEKIFLHSGISAIGRIIIDQDTVMRMVLKKIDFLNESYDRHLLEK